MVVTLLHEDGSLQAASLRSFGRDPLNLLFGAFAYAAVYAANGELISDSLGDAYFPINGKPEAMLIEPAAGYNFRYNEATGKVLAYVTSTGVEVANAVDLTALSLKFVAWGR